MTISEGWPSYTMGPRDSLFAIGVASAKYVELETVIEFLFGTVFELDMEATRIIMAKIGFEVASKLMSQRLNQIDMTSKDERRPHAFF